MGPWKQVPIKPEQLFTPQQPAQPQQQNVGQQDVKYSDDEFVDDYKIGTIALVWRDDTKSAELEKTKQQLPLEFNKFKTKSIMYISDFREYNNLQEKISAINEFQEVIQNYSNLPRTGSYCVMDCFIVSGIGQKTVVLY